MSLHNEEVLHHHAAAAAVLPQNTSSWELLDIVTASDDVGVVQGLTIAPTVKDTDGNVKNDVEVFPARLAALCVVTRASQQPELSTTAAHPAAMESGCASPTNTVSSGGWSLLSAPAEACVAGDAVLSTHRQTSLIVSADAAAAPINADRQPSPVASHTFLISSPPPSPVGMTNEVMPAGGVGDGGGDGWSTTSYEEVCMNDVLLRSGGATTEVASAIVSECTTPLPLRRSASPADARTSTCLPENAVIHDVNNVSAEAVAAAAVRIVADQRTRNEEPSAAPRRPSASRLMSSLFRTQRDALHDHEGARSRHTLSRTVAAGAGARTATVTWSARRMSFLSSSTATVALSGAFIPCSSLVGHADPTPLFCSPSAAERSAPSPPSSPLSPFYSVTVSLARSGITEATQRCWMQTCGVCADSAQQVRRGLHRVCHYVWMDLRNHWYPQLRLVLGDHSCGTKGGQRTPRAYRRLAHKKSAKDAAGTSSCEATPHPTQEMQQATGRWRSVSAPCADTGALHMSPDTQHTTGMSLRETWKGSGAGGDGGDRPSLASSSHGLELCVAVTADAVASAVQGLIVFLL
jgi:hypothetical protein